MNLLKRQFDALMLTLKASTRFSILSFGVVSPNLVETARRNTASHYNWPRR
jgi:hypothetical protein